MLKGCTTFEIIREWHKFSLLMHGHMYVPHAIEFLFSLPSGCFHNGFFLLSAAVVLKCLIGFHNILVGGNQDVIRESPLKCVSNKIRSCHSFWAVFENVASALISPTGGWSPLLMGVGESGFCRVEIQKFYMLSIRQQHCIQSFC